MVHALPPPLKQKLKKKQSLVDLVSITVYEESPRDQKVMRSQMRVVYQEQRP